MRLFRFLKTKMKEDRNRARGYGRGQPSAIDKLRKIGLQQVGKKSIQNYKNYLGRFERASSTSFGKSPPKLNKKGGSSLSRNQVGKS